jgi:hypothetical protein
MGVFVFLGSVVSCAVCIVANPFRWYITGHALLTTYYYLLYVLSSYPSSFRYSPSVCMLCNVHCLELRSVEEQGRKPWVQDLGDAQVSLIIHVSTCLLSKRSVIVYLSSVGLG